MSNPTAANVLDTGAIALWLASISNMLPAIAALLSIAWFALRIAESHTVQKMLGRYAWMDRKEKRDED